MSDKAPKDQEQKIAEAEVEEFKQELGPFVIAAETTRMAMVFTDAREADNPIIFANDSFLKLTGYNRDEVLAQSFNFILASGASKEAIAEVEAAFAYPDKEGPEIHYRRKDGSECWASLFVNPVKDDQGMVVQHFLSLVDTTRYKTAEQNAALLIDELNHRVKNTLATVQSIVTQAVRNSQDPETIQESIVTRIAALSRSHDLLGREKWDGAGLHDLVREALAPFRAAERCAERFTIEGENIRLSPKATLALGIAFNELATNAVKYGAFSNKAGTISIKWTIEAMPDGRWLCLHWRETGGPPVTMPTSKVFGSRVIEQGWRTSWRARSSWITQPKESFAQFMFRPHKLCLMDDYLLLGKRVLVIEDEMLVLMSIEDLLGDLGCTSITVAGNVETALDCIAANKFDLATLDVNLNGTRSYAVAEALEDSHIPFAFATGYGEHGIAEGYGEHPVLDKPFSRARFNDVVS